MPNCAVTWNPGVWPYLKRCHRDAVVRVKLFEADATEHELDLCGDHADAYAADYPDNIIPVASYSG